MIQPVDDDDWWKRGRNRDADDDDFQDDDEDVFSDEDEEPLVECPQCGAEVYDDANQCPACGWWFETNPGTAPGKLSPWMLLGFIGAGFVVLTWILRR